MKRSTNIETWAERTVAARPPVLRSGFGPLHAAQASWPIDLLGGDVGFAGAMYVSLPGAPGAVVAARAAEDSTIAVATPSVETIEWAVGDASPSGVESIAAIVAPLLARRGGGGVRLWMESSCAALERAAPLALLVAVARAAASAGGILLSGDDLAEVVLAGARVDEPDIAEARVRAALAGRRDHLLPVLCQPDELCDPLALPSEIEPVVLSTRDSWWTPGKATVLRTAVAIAYRLIAERMGLVVRTGERGAPQEVDDPYFDGYLANVDPVTFASEFRDHLPEHLTGAEFLERWGGVADPAVSVDASVTYPVKQAAIYALSEHHRACIAVDAVARGARHDGPSRGRVLGAQLEQAYLAERDFEWTSVEAQRLITEVRKRGPDRGLLGVRTSAMGGPLVALIERGDDAERALREAIAAFEREYGRSVDAWVGSAEGGLEAEVAKVALD